MRTLVEVVACRGPGGRTVLPVVRAGGQYAVRRTGPGTVHLVVRVDVVVQVVVRRHVDSR